MTNILPKHFSPSPLKIIPLLKLHLHKSHLPHETTFIQFNSIMHIQDYDTCNMLLWTLHLGCLCYNVLVSVLIETKYEMMI